MMRDTRPPPADLIAVARRILHLLVLGAFLLVWSESVRAEYDPSRCPDARTTEALLIAGVTPETEPGLWSADLEVDLVCTSCCHSPITSAILQPPSRAVYLAPAAPDPWVRLERPQLILYESLRPPRA